MPIFSFTTWEAEPDRTEFKTSLDCVVSSMPAKDTCETQFQSIK